MRVVYRADCGCPFCWLAMVAGLTSQPGHPSSLSSIFSVKKVEILSNNRWHILAHLKLMFWCHFYEWHNRFSRWPGWVAGLTSHTSYFLGSARRRRSPNHSASCRSWARARTQEQRIGRMRLKKKRRRDNSWNHSLAPPP